MKMFYLLLFPLALILTAGCQRGGDDKAAKPAPPTAQKKDPEAEIEANLAKLSAEDRKLAEAQRYCAVENKNRLGSMGVPMKIMIRDEPVFLCCDGCETRARAHADRTLAKVRELKKSDQ
jgi:hypothetical protein